MSSPATGLDLAETRERRERATMKWLRPFAALGFALVGVACLGVGLAISLDWVASHPPGPALTIEPNVQSFGTLQAKSDFIVKFTVINATSDPRRLVGAEGICTVSGCLGVLPEDLPFEVPSHGRRALRVRVLTRQPGHFTMTIPLYSDDGQHFKLPITVIGRVVPASKTAVPSKVGTGQSPTASG